MLRPALEKRADDIDTVSFTAPGLRSNALLSRMWRSGLLTSATSAEGFVYSFTVIERLVDQQDGRQWAAFVAHVTLEDALLVTVPDFRAGARLQYQARIPQFSLAQRALHWTDIDDFGAMLWVPDSGE